MNFLYPESDLILDRYGWLMERKRIGDYEMRICDQTVYIKGAEELSFVNPKLANMIIDAGGDIHRENKCLVVQVRGHLSFLQKIMEMLAETYGLEYCGADVKI